MPSPRLIELTEWGFYTVGSYPVELVASIEQACSMPSKKSAANVALGSAIRARRKARGYTQETFAADADIDRSYYGAIERGEFNLTVDTILKITAGLQMTASELFQRAGL
jgi:DNA-binding XRE family transcriptional regulator